MSRVTDAHIAARKNQILDAAWTCFGRNGYHRTTMQDVATEAGISAGAIYRYFDGKEAVLAAINQRSQQMGRDLVAAAAAPNGDPIRSISVIGEAMMRLFRDPAFETIARINIEIWPELLRHEELRQGLRTELRFWRSTVAALMADARARGDLRPDVDPDALAVVFMCAWEGLRHFRLVDQAFDPEAVVQLFRSLLSDEAADRRVFQELMSEEPIGIPHSMPAPSPAIPSRQPTRKRVQK